MKSNKLTIQINKSVAEVFAFTITPPNSSKWIPGVIDEETNEWPVKTGTVYKLQTEKSNFKVTVTAIKENEMVDWVSKDKNFHCRYTYRKINGKVAELEYFEWVDKGKIDEPFTQAILQRLKTVIESQ